MQMSQLARRPGRRWLRGRSSRSRTLVKAGFVAKDGLVNWPGYYDYVNSQTNYGRMPLHNREVSVKEASDREAVKKQEDGVIVKVDEATMKARFQDWMEQYGWSYRTEKEKARRHSDDFDWERYIDHINNMAAHGWYIGREEFSVSEAVKQRCKELATNHAEGRSQMDNSKTEKR
ncbi:hypothetical protein SEVIR_7G279700v4 [Setaria viridis]|uniref:Cathepsin propeptide inhibitor domain-containing protein n=1 Tax=Setaria viridis TaxID=4556 RepID=A0A4V6D4M8_SETVI|nr:uncharacterized protein LOC117864017 [Setaria viridis]XP_034603869.1 uncharacterized protein LOC117864017 [Setaria viridis]TKW07016.1 hypothetical protein SEVIR_7G279700v2 [Setaria viridis]